MKQIPLYEQIYEEIREKIEERWYRVGDRLPSEKELSEQYHVSRITSKKAVELLAEEGLVTRIPGKGTFVIEHQEMPKAREIPADSMTEKKPLPDHPPVIGVVLDGFGADFGCTSVHSKLCFLLHEIRSAAKNACPRKGGKALSEVGAFY